MISTGDERPYAMFSDHWKYFWVIREPFRYRDRQHLIEALDPDVIEPAESMCERIARERPRHP